MGTKVPVEVINALSIQNIDGWNRKNEVTYYPNGDKPNKETNKAIVFHQKQNGEVVVVDRYTF